MRAFKLIQWGQPGEYVEVPKAQVGHGEILVQIKAVGLCHSDLDMMDSKPGSEPYAKNLDAGYILGHENAGIVAELGPGVTDLRVGESVVVYHMHHCGNCDFCQSGVEQHCEFYKRGNIGMTRGCGLDGGLAEYLAVPRSEVVSIGANDPVLYAPLTDAGVTAYHAIQSFIHRIKPNHTVAVIGIGGLGAYAVQFLKVLSPAKIFAIDRFESCLEIATQLGADEVVLSNEMTYTTIMDKTTKKGIDFIADFVGNNFTLELATKISRPQGRITVAGMQGGTVPVGWSHIATSCEFALSLGSTRQDLRDVCRLVEQGKVQVSMQKFGFDEIPEAYDLLRQGKLSARAVIVMD